MTPISIRLKKYGHITQVFVDGKEIYQTAVTPKYEKAHIEALLRAISIPMSENVNVWVDE